MSTGARKLIVVGDGAVAEVVAEYFRHDSPYDVVAFAVERQYLKRETLLDLPVVALENLPSLYAPGEHAVYVGISYTQLNRLRARLAQACKAMGYALASYVSSRASVWPNVTIGEHCFIFENNVLQPFVTIADNVILWSGNHIGHHSQIAENVFVASHVVISGLCHIGANSFIGVNATIANDVKIGRDNWVGPSVLVLKDTEEGAMLRAPAAELAKVSAPRFFKVRD